VPKMKNITDIDWEVSGKKKSLGRLTRRWEGPDKLILKTEVVRCRVG